MSASLPSTDVRASDLAIATALTLAVFAASLLALSHARLDHRAELPVIDPGVAIPIAVRPVADLPGDGAMAAAGADGQAPAVVPKAWRRKVQRASAPALQPELPWSEPEPEPVLDDTVAPVETVETVEHRPKPKPKPPATPEQPAAEPSQEPDADEPVVEPDAAPADAPSEDELAPVEGEAEGQGEAASEGQGEGAGQGAGEGEGQGEGAGEGEGEGAGTGEGTDPLLERAIAFYRARLVAWFSARFRVSGSGLSSSDLAKYRVRVNIDIGDDLRIVDWRILSSDHPAFDKAARDMLDKLRGEKLPPPPENYPGAVQRQLTVTFTCAEDTCD